MGAWHPSRPVAGSEARVTSPVTGLTPGKELWQAGSVGAVSVRTGVGLSRG